ncbi:MAG: tyrosine phosphatase family protein, partial [Methylocella sp.]
KSHVEKLLAFVRRWDQAAPLLIHCWAGVSRSTAAALIAACALCPHRDEAGIAREIRANSLTATPNPRLVAIADTMLGRNGRMIAAIEKIGRGCNCFEGVPFALELR